MSTEQHPLEYADFEGVIPEGQYGAGTVMVWDRGPYYLIDRLAARAQLARGELKVVLHGRKLRGGFLLVQAGAHSTGRSRTERWLLIKHRDEFVDPSWDVENTELDRSVLTGRTLEDIASGPPAKERKVGHLDAAS